MGSDSRIHIRMLSEDTEELGGEIVTIGADAHRPEHVAFDFDKAGEILISCGFSYYAEFKGRKPIFKRIVP